MRAHLEHMRCSAEILRHKFIGDAHGHIVVERVIVDTLDPRRHFRIFLHLLPCPVPEVLTYVVNFGRTGLCCLFVCDSFCRPVPSAFCLRYGDRSVLNGCFNEGMSHDGFVQHLANNTHRAIFLLGQAIIGRRHDPRATGGSKAHGNVGAILHIFLIELWVDPRRAKREVYQVGWDVHWQYLLQCLDIAVIEAVLVVFLRLAELLTHIAAQILIRQLQLLRQRVLKSIAVVDDVSPYFFRRFSELSGNVRNINAPEFEYTCDDTVLDIGWGRLLLLLDNSLAEDVCLAEMPFFPTGNVGGFIVLLKSKHVRVVHVIAEECNGGILVEMSVCGYKIIVCLIEPFKQRPQATVTLVVDLIVEKIGKSFLDGRISIETLDFRMSLDLVAVHLERIIASDVGNDELAVIDIHFTYLPAVRRLVLYKTAVSWSGNGLVRIFCPLLAGETVDKIRQHLLLVFVSCREKSFGCRSECVAFLEAETHHTGHILGVFDEIAVVIHGQLLDNRNVLPLYLACLAGFVLHRAFTRNGAHINGVWSLTTVHPLSDDDDV